MNTFIQSGLLVILFFMLQACASSGSGTTGVAADSFQGATPSNQYIYRSPPPAVARALR